MAKRKKPAPVAHFIAAADVYAARRGNMVPTVCGVSVTGIPAEGTPVCQTCVVAQMTVDDAERTEFAARRYTAGHDNGVRVGTDQATRATRAATMREIREAAERRAAELKHAG